MTELESETHEQATKKYKHEQATEQYKLKYLVSKLHAATKDKKSSIISEDVVLLREKLRNECEILMKKDSLRKQCLDTLWNNCCYEPIRHYRSKGTMDGNEKNWLRAFISIAVGHLSLLSEKFDDLKYTINIYLGDLRRYSYSLFGNNNDRVLSFLYYKNALYWQLTHGQVLNQIALLEQGVNPSLAIQHYLRSLLMEQPYTKALPNLESLLAKTRYEDEFRQSALDFIRVLISQYNRVDVDQHKNKFERILTEQMETMSLNQALAVTYSVSLASIYMLKSINNEDGFRNILLAKLSIWQLFLKRLKENVDKKRESEMLQQRRRRRTKSNGDDSDDSDEGKLSENESQDLSDDSSDLQDYEIPDELIPVLLVVLEWLVNVLDKQMETKRMSVATRLQMQTLLKSLVELLNHCLPFLQRFMDNGVIAPGDTQLEWLLNAPLIDKKRETQVKCLAIYVKKAINSDVIPVVFERFFKFVSNESELQLMKNMAKLHLDHTSETSKKSDSLPVYILPDADVLKHRSNVIRNFINKTKMKVVVPRTVISELEKTKKDNQTAREVVRSIENYLAQGQIQILEKNLASLLDYAKEILIERNAQSVGTLVATIIIMGTTEPTGLAEISIENVDEFNSRYKSSRRKGNK